MYANIKSTCSTPDANIYVRNISVFKGNMFYVEDKKMLLYWISIFKILLHLCIRNATPNKNRCGKDGSPPFPRVWNVLPKFQRSSFLGFRVRVRPWGGQEVKLLLAGHGLETVRAWRWCCRAPPRRCRAAVVLAGPLRSVNHGLFSDLPKLTGSYLLTVWNPITTKWCSYMSVALARRELPDTGVLHCLTSTLQRHPALPTE